MVNINIKKKNAKYEQISIKGHALYDNYGKDIVCSAISSIVITTVNGLLAIDEGSLSYQISDEGLELNYIKQDEITQKLINNMVSLLKELEQKYKANIKVK